MMVNKPIDEKIKSLRLCFRIIARTSVSVLGLIKLNSESILFPTIH